MMNTPTIAATLYILNHCTSLCAWRTRLPLLLLIESLYINVRVKNTPTIAAIYWIIVHHCAREEHAYHCCYILNHYTSLCAWRTRLPLLLLIESSYINVRVNNTPTIAAIYWIIIHHFAPRVTYFHSHIEVFLFALSSNLTH